MTGKGYEHFEEALTMLAALNRENIRVTDLVAKMYEEGKGPPPPELNISMNLPVGHWNVVNYGGKMQLQLRVGKKR